MDSVIVFFGGALFDEVEQEAVKYGFSGGTVSRSSDHFYLWRYSEEEMKAEHEPDDLRSLRLALGTEVKSAFQVVSRHGASARFAVQVVHSLMSTFKPSVLDDDFGNLWLPERVAACAASNLEEGIYALRPDA
jgi:hypothetical protein